MDSWMDGWTFAEMADVSCCSERTMYRRWDDAKKAFIDIWLKLYGESPFPQWDERQAKAKAKGQN